MCLPVSQTNQVVISYCVSQSVPVIHTSMGGCTACLAVKIWEASGERTDVDRGYGEGGATVCVLADASGAHHD